jgi:hypothetical protein
MSFRVFALAAAFVAAGFATNRASAMPLSDPAGIRAALEDVSITAKVQYSWGGRNYCWYDDGWNGPGWYWCGQYLTRGIGWGGGVGWHGWRGGGARVGGARVGGARVGGARVGGARVSGARVSGGRARMGGGGGRGGRGRR